MSQGQHFGQQIHADGMIDAGDAGQSQGQIPGAGGYVQGRPLQILGGQAGGAAFPTVVHPAGHQGVHQVIAAGDAGEKGGDVTAAGRAGQLGHDFRAIRRMGWNVRLKGIENQAHRLPG